MAGTSIQSVSLTDGGTGFVTIPDVVIEGGGGHGAEINAVLTSSTSNPAYGYVSELVIVNSGLT